MGKSRWGDETLQQCHSLEFSLNEKFLLLSSLPPFDRLRQIVVFRRLNRMVAIEELGHPCAVETLDDSLMDIVEIGVVQVLELGNGLRQVPGTGSLPTVGGTI